MNNLIRNTFRWATIATNTTPNALKNVFGKRDFTRTLWHMSKTPENSGYNTVLDLHKPSINCSCGCGGKKHVHTKGERELVEFLTEEIIAERKSQKFKNVPTCVDGFNVKLDGAEVELSKVGDKEKIVVNFNVNHTVDSEEEPEINPNDDKPNIGEMRSKPQFEVDIVRGNTTLSFTCSFLQGTAQEGEYNDVFGIDEMVLYENEWNDKVYAVAGDVLDGYLYDLLMNLLEEKGVTNEFAEKLSDLATAYEHASYIKLLENLSKFSSGKPM
ncbi:complement component 1 Q subcomponent-binding protein, mitochondrial-like [Teleopsis dalmanni]|uniref:complement component 1 Q subcomponent-binding protein, mitochondrial-like n=1 Tax=Teleopsis dalmanni TaxID=139649 RepID=UPI0018CE087B|nr:complement component 1 Q subcomponent-binding protein, mitochondrial-like [Teleopsis dalmanni]XP_037955313.1 complement component 1 Q subcomponent-binding protein, mitochondrial-like [Teleopsis dalmanni]